MAAIWDPWPVSRGAAGVIDAMGDAYPELKKAAAKIAEVVTQEESGSARRSIAGWS